MDFSRAFNEVQRDRLILKLENPGTDGPLLKWTTDFLVGRR